MNITLVRKLVLAGWLVLGGYAAFAGARIVSAFTLDEDFLGEIGKRDRVYQFELLANPAWVVIIAVAAVIGLAVLWITRRQGGDQQASTLLMVTKLAAAAAAVLAIGLAIAFATDDETFGSANWERVVGVLSSLPISAAVLLLPNKLDASADPGAADFPRTQQYRPTGAPPPPPSH